VRQRAERRVQGIWPSSQQGGRACHATAQATACEYSPQHGSNAGSAGSKKKGSQTHNPTQVDLRPTATSQQHCQTAKQQQ
jgi:hypothetical protein